MRKRLEEFFGATGPLARHLESYEPRSAQIQMAITVAKALGKETRAVIEAGTGTGKTLAYLVPVVLSDKKVLISTATKNLQEQIFTKDIPLLNRLGLNVEAVYLKGRSNYICLFRFAHFQSNPMFRARKDRRYFPAILEWVGKTQTGDRAELSALPDDYATWVELSTSSDACLRTECPHYNECFVTRVRRSAHKAQVIIVNHHLFFADLAVRSGGYGELLPDVDAVIFDEAHHLEESASSFFGRSVSIWRVRDLIGDIGRALRALPDPPGSLLALLSELEEDSQTLFRAIGRRLPRQERAALDEDIVATPAVESARASIVQALERLYREVGSLTPLGETAAAFARRTQELKGDLTFILARSDSSWVYLAERRGRGESVFAHAYPIDLAPFFVGLLYPRHKTTIFTSATLTVDQQFHFFRSRIALGPDEPVDELMLEPTFDFMQQSLLFVPDDPPEPNSPQFIDAVTPVIEELLDITNGRAFVLFTSYRNLRAVHERLKDSSPYNLLVQGESPKSALLERFRSEPSVLLATASFWEGVDVQGPRLSLVIIDKLPFAHPGDPVVRARIDYVREAGGDPFRQLQLPQTAISLKQGFGRLIRHREDVGIVAILDRRLLDRWYGGVFLATLPRARRTRDLAVVRRWWETYGVSDAEPSEVAADVVAGDSGVDNSPARD